ncbi:S41 family peptidase [Kaistella palustris]|uniref:S41 family peptidase n=1 Tax=Kaistella palustris TaxID=493376 RepID=UPI000422B6EB|nr:S41 family peptidase [Kaistella palustris]
MRHFALLFVVFACTSCVSVKRYNEKLEIPVAAEKLRNDVDFSYAKLQKLHPNLYWYISREDLEYKFDSLKSTIQKPLRPNEFYQKLAPVIAQIREGHLRLVSNEKRLTKKEIKDLKNQKGLLSRYNFLVDEDRIFVLDNADKIPNMEVGGELLKIHDIPVKDLLGKYRPFVNSDGYNTTFQKYMLAKRWPQYFTSEFGILDSVKVETKYQNNVRSFYLHREKMSAAEKKKDKLENKKLSNSETGKTRDYNIYTRTYNRDLQFPTADSAVAYMKIKTFSGVYSRRFYRQSFAQLQKSPAKTLIIDIRNNLGGSLYEVNNLYSYLVSTDFQFINDIEVTSRASVFHADYFRGSPLYLIPLQALSYPIYLAGTAFSTKKVAHRFYLRNNGFFSLKKPKRNNFKGKIYVLINGSSFSAASILAAKLKGDGRAFLVGEKTGGANDGTVAGRYSTEKLPGSELYLPIGLMLIQPHINFTHTEKGVTPDFRILPTIKQLLEKKDVQLDWIMNDLKKNKDVTPPQVP